MKKLTILTSAIAFTAISLSGAQAATTSSTTTTNPQQAFAAYSACITAHGGTMPTFGGFGGGHGPAAGGAGGNWNGQRPTTAPSAGATPYTRPTLSAADQAARTACASLRPSFGGMGRGHNGAGAGASGNMAGMNMKKSTTTSTTTKKVVTKTTTTKAPAKKK
jgi:hypothetical protein